MKILFIGGTGNISMACTRLALESGLEVYHLNRGSSQNTPPNVVRSIHCDINKTTEVR